MSDKSKFETKQAESAKKKSISVVGSSGHGYVMNTTIEDNKAPDYRIWNRRRKLTLEEATYLTVGVDPETDIHDQATRNRYKEILALANEWARSDLLPASSDGLYQYVIPAHWFRFLETMEESAPPAWKPIQLVSESKQNIKGQYRPNFEEAVNIAIAMAKSPNIPTPTTQKQLYGHMKDNPNDCPVNYGAGKTPKIATVEKNVRDGGGNPLKDPRFLEVIAQNP